jgi:serine/threonine protein kinase
MIENPRWVAPETLETGVYTDKSDVYSFGIVCNELVTRRLPFEEIAFDSEMEKAIKAGARPAVDPGTLDKYQKLVAECWARDPSARPTFGSIVMRLQLVMEVMATGRPSTSTL